MRSCSIYDYDVVASVYREKEQWAKKPHTCCECGEVIQVGDLYQYVFGVWDGEPQTYRTCETCADLRESMAEAGVCPCFGDLKREHLEYVERNKGEK